MSYSISSKFFPEYPRTIQVQTVTGCNATCVMCPTGLSPQRMEHHHLPMELWEKIIQECSGWERPLRSMVIALFNEPLIDKRLFDMMDMAKKQLPSTRFLLVTNGSLLTKKNVERLLQSQFDAIRVSVNAYSEESFALLNNGLELSRIVEGTKRLLEKSKTVGKPKVIVSMVEVQYNTEEVQQFVKFWSQLGAAVHVSPAWNRAGNLPSVNDFQIEYAEQEEQTCSKPFVTMCITYDGDVVFCCADYSAGIVLGNVKEQKLLEVWMGPRHQAALLKMFKGSNELCNKCDKLFSFQTHRDGVIPEHV